jgi:UDP-N-acetylglucosamine 1-carboxyvinyltransferase
MAKYLIKGGKKISGEIKISGAKNAALPIIAATLLTKETCIINNVPDILDIKILLEIISQMGADVSREGNRVEITAKEVSLDSIDKNLFNKLRASILLLGPMLARLNQAKLNYPGGCIIGKRPIDIHLGIVEKLGGEIEENRDHFKAQLNEISLDNNKIYLRTPSVTATENLIMMVAGKKTEIKVENAAREPHITNLANMLNMMGAEIEGQGTNRLTIKGSKNLKGVEIDIVPDAIEASSFTALALAAQAKLKLVNVGNQDNLFPILNYLDQINADYKHDEKNEALYFSGKQELVSANFKTSEWPGFPTDAQPPFTVLATQTKGTTLVHETIFEQRLYYIDQLTNMGAKIIPCDPHRVVVSGPTKLHGAKIVSPDIRAGMAMVIAGLIADGQTEIDNIELIERGHEDLVIKLQGVGADIIKRE